MAESSDATSVHEEIAPEGWRETLEQVTRDHRGFDVTIEVVGSRVGDQEEAVRLPFVSVEYDPKDDVVVIAVGGRDGRYPVALRHMVWHPRRIFVDPPTPETARALDVVDGDDNQTIVMFHRPPALPPAT